MREGLSAEAGIIDFDAFYVSRWARTVGTAHSIIGSASVGEEIAQEAFLRVHEQWASIETPDAFLRTVLVNLCRSHLRRARRERATASERVHPVVPEPSLDETWLATFRLPFRQRAVLVLRYYEDLTEHQIAEVLGCRVGTVKSAHHRALTRLREELS